MTTETVADWLTVQEFAEITRIAPGTIYRLVRRGEIPAIRIGGAIRIRVEEVEAACSTRR